MPLKRASDVDNPDPKPKHPHATGEILPSHDDRLVTDEVHLRSYLEAALGGILAINSDGCIVFMNGHTEQMFGYPRSEIVGHKLTVLLPERFHGQYASALQAYFVAPSVKMLGMDLGLLARRKNAEEFPVEVGLSFVQGHEGTIALGFVTDVTDRKRLLDELSRADAELRRSNTDLENFAYLASHDLREPLRVITSYLELLGRRCHEILDVDSKEYLEIAVNGATRMKNLIEDLLNYSRIGKITPDFHRVPAERILQLAIDNLKVAIAESSAEVTWDPLPEIFADPSLLEQVFQNLIANGIKFHKDCTPRVHVSAFQQGSEWVFALRDNGIGMEPRDSGDVFRIFERLHSSEEYPGAGVGLAISQKIVEHHKGRIWFESKSGEGTTFFFSIPHSTMDREISLTAIP